MSINLINITQLLMDNGAGAMDRACFGNSVDELVQLVNNANGPNLIRGKSA